MCGVYERKYVFWKLKRGKKIYKHKLPLKIVKYTNEV